MVRLDKCVEALYDDSVTNDNRNRNLQILHVMKGAISMSRSKTGECIFRTNKSEQKNLERVLQSEVRNSHYNISQIDSKRKQVVMRWSKVLENQTMCSSESLFEELMDLTHHDEPEVLRVSKSESPVPGEGKLKHLVNLRLSAIEKETNAGTYVPVIPKRRKLSFQSDDGKSSPQETRNDFVTENKLIRDKYKSEGLADGKMKGDVTNVEVPVDGARGRSRLVNLPVIHAENPEALKQKDQSMRPDPIVRDLTDWGNWGLKDKSWIKVYLHREKTRHEDLIIRNALNKIESDMSGANMIQRQQMRQKLQAEKQQQEAEVRRQMRAHKLREASFNTGSPSPSVRTEASERSVKVKGDDRLKEKDIPAEEQQTAVSNTHKSKHVNFDDNIVTFEPAVSDSQTLSAITEPLVVGKKCPTSKRVRKSRPERSLLPAIPENVRSVKQRAHVKGRN